MTLRGELAINISLSNRLLAGLPACDRQLLLANATCVELDAQSTLSTAGYPLRYAYFPTSCLIGLMVPQASDSGFEVGLIGFEGMHDAGCALGLPTPVSDAIVRVPGHAWRIEAAVLAGHVLVCKTLRNTLTAYSYVQHTAMAGRAVCGQFHSLIQRLCNYLLKLQDRLRSADLLITHDALSRILGARRAGITEAAGTLQKLGLIRYCRGHIVVIDRPGLKAIACDCYAQDVATYEGTMGELSPAPAASEAT